MISLDMLVGFYGLEGTSSFLSGSQNSSSRVWKIRNPNISETQQLGTYFEFTVSVARAAESDPTASVTYFRICSSEAVAEGA